MERFESMDEKWIEEINERIEGDETIGIVIGKRIGDKHIKSKE